MITDTAIIYSREDLIVGKKEADFKKIRFHDVKHSIKQFQKNAIVLFIDDNGRTKIWKNRYGDSGIVK